MKSPKMDSVKIKVAGLRIKADTIRIRQSAVQKLLVLYKKIASICDNINIDFQGNHCYIVKVSIVL
ncbi:hypothetical protein D4759_22780 [Clostridiales bacterium AHG0011]|nr:hypothetical protein [Clostridiales bacterium AHG0011]